MGFRSFESLAELIDTTRCFSKYLCHEAFDGYTTSGLEISNRLRRGAVRRCRPNFGYAGAFAIGLTSGFGERPNIHHGLDGRRDHSSCSYRTLLDRRPFSIAERGMLNRARPFTGHAAAAAPFLNRIGHDHRQLQFRRTRRSFC